MVRASFPIGLFNMANRYRYQAVLKSGLQIPPVGQPFEIMAADCRQAYRLALKMMGFKISKVRSKKQKDYDGQLLLFKG